MSAYLGFNTGATKTPKHVDPAITALIAKDKAQEHRKEKTKAAIKAFAQDLKIKG